MDAGRLDRQITLRQASESVNANHVVKQSWSNLATVWARKIDVGGAETFRGVQLTAEVETVFVIRYRSDVTPKHRVKYGSQEWDILYTRELGRTEGLELHCKARVA